VSEWLRVAAGSLAWQPLDTEPVRELDRVDFPTVGLLAQDRSVFLFVCLDGVGTPTTLWAYAPLLTRLPLSAGGFDLDLLETLRHAPYLTFAVADANGKVRSASEKVDPTEFDGSLFRAASASLGLTKAELDDLGIEDSETSAPA
jgi:hypothetical protein